MTFLENVDKTKLQKITLIVISALVLTALALLLVIIIMSIIPKTPGLSDGIKNLKDYTVTDADINTGSLILADDDHPYTANEESLDLVGCIAYRDAQPDATGVGLEDASTKNYIPWKDMRLPTITMQNLHKMLTAAKNDVGENPITIDAAYTMVQAGAEEKPEYKTGLLVLLSDYTSDYYERVELSSAYRKWFDANAYKYGFIESFEDGYRYVGAPHAKLIKEYDDISTLADYIAFLKDKTGYDKTARVNVDGVEYAIYYVACEEGQTIKVPANNTYTISGTNEGGVIITVKLSK